MAITGAHILLYTPEPEKLRATLRDIFGWKHVDAGGGWLVFALPPAELGVHPAGPEGRGADHQFSLMCDDIQATVRELRAKGVVVDGEPHDAGWGVTVTMTLPGNLSVMLYEPRHPTAIPSSPLLADD
jgi:catechol 2,3-dioxygenase-like lactoylglutathione lyase family enzyme